MNNKKEGAYYTPKKLADYIVKRIFSYSTKVKGQYSVLEPSCGDGNFLEALEMYFDENMVITAVEKNNIELLKAKNKVNKNKGTFYNENYLKFQERDKNEYDLVLGNPPYVSKKYLNDEDISIMKEILSRFNLKISNLNLWIPFVLSSIEKVNDTGNLALVLPAEILLTISSEGIRKILLERFEYIEIINFNEIVFEGIEQDTVVLLCYSKHKKKGISYYSTKNLESLVNEEFEMVTNHSSFDSKNKWSQLILSSSEIELLNRIQKKFRKVSDVSKTSPGIVTGANNYFIVNKDEVRHFDLKNYIKPIISKSLFVKPCVDYNLDSFNQLVNANKKCYFLDFSKIENEEEILNYLKVGLEEKINERFKCKKRKKWYVTPNIKKQGELLFFKRNHIGLKVLMNSSKALVTDGAYLIDLDSKFDKKSFVFGFYTLIPLIFAEVLGRFYGGGVLELTPKEFQSLPFVYEKISDEEFNKLDELVKGGDFEEVVNYTSRILLIEKLGISIEDIDKLKIIWKKLMNRRFKL